MKIELSPHEIQLVKLALGAAVKAATKMAQTATAEGLEFFALEPTALSWKFHELKLKLEELQDSE